MPIDDRSAPAGTALVFPGQGAQHPAMLDSFRDVPEFARLCDLVSTLLGHDVGRLDQLGAKAMSANLASSLLTVLCGVLALRRLAGCAPPIAVAGYSVGQWTALHGAGIIDEVTLLTLIAQRARLMDEAAAAAPPSGMLAVIGIERADLDAVCASAASAGVLLRLANDNAPGQATLGGSLAGLDFAERELAPRRPRVMRRLPVAAAWHGPLMEPVVAPLRALLSGVRFAPARCPVVDNATGDWLPLDDLRVLPERLAVQVARPVLWQQGVRRMVQAGVGQMIECGWGDVLSRFGFFIDRSVRHEALAPLPRERA